MERNEIDYEIKNFNARIIGLESSLATTQDYVERAMKKVSEIEDEIQKLNGFSFETIVTSIERAIAAYRASCQLSEQLDAMRKNRFDLMSGQPSRRN